MTNANVIFKAEKVSHGWQIKCYCPGGKIEYVTGFWDEQSTQNYYERQAAGGIIRSAPGASRFALSRSMLNSVCREPRIP